MKKKVLIVEDDDDLRRGLSLRVRAFGYEVVEAVDGYSAVAMARDAAPDVVLLDIGLPGGDGISVLERYAQMMQLATMPVVVLTGRDPFVTEPLVRRFNVSGFLRKPADNEELRTALADAIGSVDPAFAATHPRPAADSVTRPSYDAPASLWFG